MPIEDAVNFMKQAAQKSYGKKGQDVVEMNWKAIDAGVDAIHKVDVPASWSNPEADPAPKALTGRPELVKQIDVYKRQAMRCALSFYKMFHIEQLLFLLKIIGIFLGQLGAKPPDAAVQVPFHQMCISDRHYSEFGTFCAGQYAPHGTGEPHKGTIACIL